MKIPLIILTTTCLLFSHVPLMADLLLDDLEIKSLTVYESPYLVVVDAVNDQIATSDGFPRPDNTGTCLLAFLGSSNPLFYETALAAQINKYKVTITYYDGGPPFCLIRSIKISDTPVDS